MITMEYRIKKVHDLIDETDISYNSFLNNLKSSEFFNISIFMDDKDKRDYINKLCSDLAIICEKYSKAIYLKNATIPQSIISRFQLSDEDIVKIIIGSDDNRIKSIVGQLTREEKQRLAEIKFRGISHNFTKLFNPENPIFERIEFLFTKAMFDIGDVPYEEAREKLLSNKVYDAFVKGRYSSLNDDYNADFISLIALCDNLQKSLISLGDSQNMECCEVFTDFDEFSLQFQNYKDSINVSNHILGGMNPRLQKIRHIYPKIESDISVVSDAYSKTIRFGKCKYASLHKTNYNDVKEINIPVKKSQDELIEEIKETPYTIGLYSTNSVLDRYIVELNECFNSTGIRISDGDVITYTDSLDNRHTISSINGQIIFTNGLPIKKIKRNNPER